MVKIVSYKDLVDKLTDIFCEYGYDGTSLTILSQNTGLGRKFVLSLSRGKRRDGQRGIRENISRFYKISFITLMTITIFQQRLKIC